MPRDAQPAESIPLIPLLRPGEAVADPVVLATWHEALADSVSQELPHDLLALWLYPASGGVVLLGPEALAQDHLDVPLPRPRLTQAAADELADVVRRAYPSVVCVPVSFSSADVGLLLVAALQPGRFGDAEHALVGRLAEAIAPTLSRAAFQWTPPGAVQAEAEPALLDEVVGDVTAGWTEARSPKDFVSLLSRAVQRIVLHDRLEVLIPGPAPGQQYRLGSHAGGPPWAEPSLIVPRETLDLAVLAGPEGQAVVADLAVPRPAVSDGAARWPEGFLAEELPEGQTIRSLLVVRVWSGGRLIAHLLAGGAAPGLYQAEDLVALSEVARLVAPRLEGYVLSSQLYTLRKQLGALRSAPEHLARIADMLATTPRFAEATQRLSEEVRAMFPCDGLAFAIRLSEGDRVVMVPPGETRHLADLPLVPIAGTPLGELLRGDLADAMTESSTETVVMVPMRAAGRVLGALVLAARGRGAIGRGDVPHAQQVADLVAPYVELMRRTAMLPAPFIPGWKRVG
ncbi:MAG TPA: hypothetical protein VFW66_10770 [Gemmatimonadales bacterium]|nr:hypothetical protein [Gemmatimonadales bacterium]